MLSRGETSRGVDQDKAKWTSDKELNNGMNDTTTLFVDNLPTTMSKEWL